MIYFCGQAVKWSCICIRRSWGRRVSACLWQLWVKISLYILSIVMGGVKISWMSADSAGTPWSAWTALELHSSLKLDSKHAFFHSVVSSNVLLNILHYQNNQDMAWLTVPAVDVQHGSSDPAFEVHCPAEFTSNPNQIDLNKLISLFWY